MHKKNNIKAAMMHICIITQAKKNKENAETLPMTAFMLCFIILFGR